MSAAAHVATRSGIACVVLENGVLRMTVLAGRGGEVHELRSKPRDVDFAPLWGEGLDVPSADAAPFADWYRGGWQEVLPNGGAPCTWEGASYDQHGEACALAWEHELLADGPERACAELRVALRQSPLRLAKRLTLERETAAVTVEERLTNDGETEQRTMWGQHVAFGAPFLSERCTIELEEGARVIPHAGELPGGRRIDPAREHRWPFATAPDGATVDLSRVPPRGAPTEMAYVTGLSEGRYAIRGEDGVGLRVEWDVERFPYLWLWQECGATTDRPWHGRGYVVGLEPFSSFPSAGLPAAVDNGTALRIAPGATIETSWRISVLDGEAGA